MWSDAVITNAGKTLLSQWAAGGATLTITGAKIGSGTVTAASLMAQTALAAEKQSMSIVNSETVAGGVRLKLQLTSVGVTTGYTGNQIGIWAKLGSGSEILMAIYQDSSGITVPTAAEMADFVFTFYAMLQMSNTGTISVTLDTSAVVTRSTLDAELAKVKITASGILKGDGAGNVTGATAGTDYAAGKHAPTHAKGGSDPVTPEAIGASTSFKATGTLTTSGWAGSAAPYTQDLTVAGLLESDRPRVDPVLGTDDAARELIKTAWQTAATSSKPPYAYDGKITFYAASKPTTNIPVVVSVVRP